MGLSRLENFLKNVRGNILYVSPNDLDATDSVDNKGNSLTPVSYTHLTLPTICSV